MAVLEFASAAAGTWIVSPRAGKRCRLRSLLRCTDAHYFRWCPAVPKKLGHNLHRSVYVLEEGLVSGAQVIQSRPAIGSFHKPILRALAVTGEAHFATAAILGQDVSFCVAKCILRFGIDQLRQ